MMRWYGVGMGAWLSIGLFWLVLVAVIVWLVVLLARPRHGGAPRPLAGPGGPWQGPVPGGPLPYGPGFGPGFVESPFEILDRRLAAGEIDLPTYQQLRAALFESRGGQP